MRNKVSSEVLDTKHPDDGGSAGPGEVLGLDDIDFPFARHRRKVQARCGHDVQAGNGGQDEEQFVHRWND